MGLTPKEHAAARTDVPWLCDRVDELEADLAAARGERDAALGRAADYEDKRDRVDELEAALEAHAEAWSNEAASWRREVLAYFQAQPDEVRWDAKELIAAIESRAVVCVENSRAARAVLSGEPEAKETT